MRVQYQYSFCTVTVQEHDRKQGYSSSIEDETRFDETHDLGTSLNYLNTSRKHVDVGAHTHNIATQSTCKRRKRVAKPSDGGRGHNSALRLSTVTCDQTTNYNLGL